MTGKARRESILKIITETKDPIPAYKLAEQFNVSRQVIVQDIALLRAEKHDIMATSRGYLIYNNTNDLVKRVIAIDHGPDKIESELVTIIDYGGRILDVMVDHDVYGQIKADLMIETYDDVNEFVSKMKSNNAVPLMTLTGGMHYHTIEAKNDKLLDIIETELNKL